MKQDKFWYQCVNCNKEYSSESILYLCPDCEVQNIINKPPKGVLKVLYKYDDIKLKNEICNHKDLNENVVSLLPIENLDSLPKLKIGSTPLYNFSELVKDKSVSLYIKYDSHNPTYSFKDRASGMVSAFAKEHGINTIITASTGNAGSSLAGICASQKQKAIVLLPATAPKAKLIQSAMYGATLVPIDGTYDDAFLLSKEITKEFGIYNRNTAYNPITIEGKKTISFELYSDFEGNLPDYIFIPVGDGVIISGIYKGFEDLLKIGLINKIPTIVAVQAENSANILDNLDKEELKFPSTKTIADSILVDIPQNFFMTKQFMKKYDGIGIKLSDNEIIEASVKLSKQTGLFSEPASAATYAGFQRALKDGIIRSESNCLLVLTGCGLKDISAYNHQISNLKPVKRDLSEVKKLLEL